VVHPDNELVEVSADLLPKCLLTALKDVFAPTIQCHIKANVLTKQSVLV